MQSKSARRCFGVVALGFCLSAPYAAAETLYKLIDKNGKVTYSEKVPRDFDGKATRLDFDPNANTATLSKPGAKNEEGGGTRRESAAERTIRSRPGDNADARIAQAKEKVEAARKALADAASNATDDDYQFIGTAGKGTRRIPTPEFASRLDGLENAVKAAEEALAAAERGS
jgi:parvulin-like peptidyl-prolyl isomerase